MMAVMVAAGRSVISIDDVRRMIAEPVTVSVVDRLRAAPSHGLYLANVEYDDKGLNHYLTYLQGGCHP